MTGLTSDYVRPTMAENEFIADGRLPYKPYGGPFQRTNAIFNGVRQVIDHTAALDVETTRTL